MGVVSMITRWLWVMVLLCMAQSTSATTQRESLWLGLNNQAHFANHHRWVYSQHSQMRLMNRPHPVHTLLVENDVGYTLNPTQYLWFGYYFADKNTSHKEVVEQRLIEQFSWNMVHDLHKLMSSRSRLEEIAFTNESQNSVVFRQLWALELVKLYAGRVNPLFYDELFVHLNNPRYASTHFLSQNRAFIGANVNQSKHSYWRVGYMNQYISGNHQRKPEMNHVLLLSYVFGDISIGLPYDA